MRCLLVLVLLVCPIAAAQVRIDAVLDEPMWASAQKFPIAYEWYPGDNVPAPVATEVLVTYDAKNLYVAFRATDPDPRRIRARYRERDAAIDVDDTVGFLVDPFNDKRRAYQFVVNPLGVQNDAINSDVEGTEDFSWDAIWDSAGRVTATGFEVEIAVPLQQLRIPAGSAPNTWGFLATRVWPRDVAHRLRSVRTDQNRNCLVCQFAGVEGFQISGTGHAAEVTPTLTANARQQRIGGALETTDREVEPGLSARWGITSGTSLNLTLNPDFSQVEADAAQLDANIRFALSFPEKRPFFLEESDLFATQLPLVFSRTIADPVAGLKLTGKSGRHTYGALVARDRVTNLLLPGTQSSSLTAIDGGSSTAIFRYRGDVGESSSAGALATFRRGDDYDNSVVSGDSYLRLTKTDTLRLQGTVSRSTLAGDSLSGHAFHGGYSHADRDWTWSARYTELSPEFRADAGLINQIGVRAGVASVQRRIRGNEKRWFRDIFLFAGADALREWDGTFNEWGSDLQAVYEGPRQTTVQLALAPNQEFFNGTTYHHMRYSVYGSQQLSRDVRAELEVRWGEAIDFTNSQSAKTLTISPGVDFAIGPHFQGQVSYDRQTFETRDGREIFTLDLPQARLLYHLNRRTYVRAILQYRDLKRSIPASIERRNLLAQLLFSYRIDAQTVFLLGYSDAQDALGRSALDPLDRTLFVKLSYAWLL